MKNEFRSWFVALTLLAMCSVTHATTITWTNTAGGNWNVPANWSPNRVPGGGDAAVFSTPGTYTVSVTDSESVSNLVLGAASGTLTLNLSAGAFTVNGPGSDSAQSALVIGGGTLNGTGSIVVGGPLTWSGGDIYGTVQFNGGAQSGGLNLRGGTLVNSGAFAWNGQVFFYPGAQLTNLVSGTITLAAGASANNEGGNNFDNEGQLNVVGTGTAYVNIPFNNNGTVTVSSGTLELGDGGTETGIFTNAIGGTLNLSGGTYTFAVNSSVGGAGNFTVSSGVANLGGSLNVAGTYTFNGGTANVTGACAITNALIIYNGALNLNGSGTITPISLTMSGGSEAGSQTLLVLNNGGFNWTGGDIYGTVHFSGGTQSSGLNLRGGTLVNSGAFAWNGQMFFYPGSQVTNLVSGTITLAAGASANNEGGNNFDNEGQLNVVGAGTASVNTPFNNNGTVTVSSGMLQLGGGGTETGIFTNAVGSTLNLNGGTYTFSANSSVVGPGNFTVSGATANLGGNLNVAGTYTLSGGTANVTGACTITNALILDNGALNLSGSGTIAPVSLTMNGGSEAGSQTLQVLGSGGFNWSGGDIYGTVHFNGGTQSSGLNLRGGTLVNSGAFAWNGQVYFYPGAQLTNLVSGTITLAAGASANNEGGNNFDNEGQLNVVGAGTASVNIPFNNHGTVTVTSGTLQLAGGVSLASGALVFGITNASNFGALNLSGSVALTGALGVTFHGYVPQVGDSFPLITYGSKTGAFTSFNLPPQINWQETYGSTVYTLSIGVPLKFTLASGQPAWTVNGFNLAVSGPVGSNYTVLVSTNLAQTNWSALTNFVSTFTETFFVDSHAPALDTHRFYRAFMH